VGSPRPWEGLDYGFLKRQLLGLLAVAMVEEQIIVYENEIEWYQKHPGNGQIDPDQEYEYLQLKAKKEQVQQKVWEAVMEEGSEPHDLWEETLWEEVEGYWGPDLLEDILEEVS